MLFLYLFRKHAYIGHHNELQRFSEVTDLLGKGILSVITENPLIWTFLWKIVKLSVIPEKSLYPNPVLPKTSVL